ncbi:hypothetical protein ACJX0J_038379 [Zea mays]
MPKKCITCQDLNFVKYLIQYYITQFIGVSARVFHSVQGKKYQYNITIAALEVFDMLEEKGTPCWNAVIVGLAMNGLNKYQIAVVWLNHHILHEILECDCIRILIMGKNKKGFCRNILGVNTQRPIVYHH